MPNFYTDVIVPDRRFHSAARISDPNLLEPVTLQKVQAVIADAATHGLQFMIFETYRSTERQAALFDQGATKLKNVGVHHYGLACDLVRNINGEPSWKGDFSILGHLAHKYGLISGIDWGNPNIKHTFIDDDHVQRCSIGRQASLFNGLWYPGPEYDPYQD
jgi:LAS superfamily LD-carboxypeptidase LdcB